MTGASLNTSNVFHRIWSKYYISETYFLKQITGYFPINWILFRYSFLYNFFRNVINSPHLKIPIHKRIIDMSSQPSSITSTSYHRRKSLSASITSHQRQRLTPTRSYPTPYSSSAKDYRQRSREFTADFERHARTPFLVDRSKCSYGRDLNSHETRQFGHTTRNSPSPKEKTIETSNFKFYPSIKCLESSGGYLSKNRESLYFNRYMHCFLLISAWFFVTIS